MNKYEYRASVNAMFGEEGCGAAFNKLTKMLVLKLAQECDMHYCYKCKQEIKTIEEMSIDHKINWRLDDNLDKCRELFWDFGNLSLSHKFCNLSDTRTNKRKHGYYGIQLNKHVNFYYAKICIDGKKMFVGQSRDALIAGFYRDVAVFKYRNGSGILNFEHLRDYYPTVKDKSYKEFSDEEIRSITSKRV